MRPRLLEPTPTNSRTPTDAAAWRICDVAWPTDVVATARTLAADGELAWLDSATSDQPGWFHQLSLLCSTPLMVLEQPDQQPASLYIAGRLADRDPNGWQLWRRATETLPLMRTAPAGLAPGWVGYVGFEMARFLERLPSSHPEELGLPLMRLALFDRGIVLDHDARRAYAIAAPAVRAAVASQPDDFPQWLRRWNEIANAADRHDNIPTPPAQVRFESSRSAHVAAVERALQYIAAGDIYQVNLAHRLSLHGLNPFSAYAAIRESNPAPYAALLSWDGGAIVSSSPELFLQLRAGEVLTRPIKGTRPRGLCSVDNQRQQRELLGSEKEAAELAMIVDLHRNDLGRVCAFGSVQVPAARRLEPHPSVYHTVADVTGRLAAGRTALDLLQACFPAGSVTGVPKIRALQIIDELEPAARGAYTGAIGILTLDGQMTFNVAIRTLQMRGARALLHVGGGVVADSDPQAEYEETLAKAQGILDGLLHPVHSTRKATIHATGRGLHQR